MNRGAIRDKIRKQAGETTASFWTDAEINGWINETISDLAWRTKCLRKNGTMTPVEDTLEYTLSSYFDDLWVTLNVYFYADALKWKPLEKRTRDQLQLESPGWLSADSGTPKYYGYDLEEDWLLIWPPPDSTNAGTDYFKVYYVYKPTDLDDDNDSPEIPNRLHEAVVEGALATAFVTRGLGDRANNSKKIYMGYITDYLIEREKEEDEEIIMRNYRS